MSVWQRLQFQMHIGMCFHCRAYLRQMRETIAVLGKLPNQPMPDAVQEALLERFRDWGRISTRMDD